MFIKIRRRDYEENNTIGNGVTLIVDATFSQCENMTVVISGITVSVIHPDSFNECMKIIGFYYAEMKNGITLNTFQASS